MVFTAISAREFACGLAVDVRRWFTPQDFKNSVVMPAVNWGPPSVVNSSGTPNVSNMSLKRLTRFSAFPGSLNTIGQFE